MSNFYEVTYITAHATIVQAKDEGHAAKVVRRQEGKDVVVISITAQEGAGDD